MGSHGATRVYGDFGDGIGAVRGAAGHQRALEVRGHVGGGHVVNVRLFVFQSPLGFGTVNLTEIVDAGVLLGLATGFDEVGNCDGGQEPDDRDDDHDLDQGEGGTVNGFEVHTFSFDVFRGSRLN